MSEYRFKSKNIIKIDKVLPDNFSEFKLHNCFVFTENAMKLLGIEK